MSIPATYIFLAMQSTPSGTSWLGLAPLVLIFVVFYFFLIRPQQVRQKKWAETLETVKNGDRVTTSGGLRGTVIAIKEDSFHLRVPPDNLRVEVVKTSVVSIGKEESGS